MLKKRRTILNKATVFLVAVIMAFVGLTPAAAFADDGARSYLESNYITGNKVITNGGDAVVKSSDGLTYTIGTATPSGNKITSIRLKMESSSGTYKSGWYISADNPYITYKNPSLNTSRSIKSRPASDYSFTATLKLFSNDTASDAIDDGTAEALATQNFTFILKAEAPKPQITFNPIDSTTKESISGAKVTVEYNWSQVSPNSDGSYTLESDKTYTVKATAEGYNSYSNSSYVPAAEGGVVDLPMEKTEKSIIAFNIKDSDGNSVSEATVKVKQGYYTTISPQADGTYSLNNGTSYSYTVSAPNYSDVSGSITPSGDKTIDITMTKNISTYKVVFDIRDNDGNIINGATVSVLTESDDEWDDNWVDVSPNGDGSYSMSKWNTYEYSISADGYKKVTGTMTPSGNDETITKSIKMEKDVIADPADIDKVNAVKTKFDSEFGALRPDFAKDKNINDVVLSKIQEYADTDTTGVTVEVKTTDDTDYIQEDGKINYVTGELNSFGTYSKNVSCTFAFKCNGAEAVSGSRVVTVCWDRDYFNGKIKADSESLSWDTIKGSNTDQLSVESDLTLPQIMTSSARTAWSTIEWTSSDPSVIAI